MKKYFSLSQEKQHFFETFTAKFPLQDPEIQSSDGEFIDILWDNGVALSLTDENAISISTPDEFQYFSKAQWEAAFAFLSAVIVKTCW